MFLFIWAHSTPSTQAMVSFFEYIEWVHALGVSVEIELKMNFENIKLVYTPVNEFNIFKSCPLSSVELTRNKHHC